MTQRTTTETALARKERLAARQQHMKEKQGKKTNPRFTSKKPVGRNIAVPVAAPVTASVIPPAAKVNPYVRLMARLDADRAANSGNRR